MKVDEGASAAPLLLHVAPVDGITKSMRADLRSADLLRIFCRLTNPCEAPADQLDEP